MLRKLQLSCIMVFLFSTSALAQVPTLTSGITSDADAYGVILGGANFDTQTYVDVRTATGGTIVAQFSPTELLFTDGVNGASDSLKFRIENSALRDELNGQGLKFYVVSPTANYMFAGPMLVQRVSPIVLAPTVASGSTSDSDNYGILLSGSNFDAQSYVDVRTANGAPIIAQYAAPQIAFSAGAYDTLKFRIDENTLRNELNGQGLRFYVVSPNAGFSFGGPMLVQRVAPVAQNPTLIFGNTEGADLYGIVLSGANYDAQTYVDIRTASGTAVIAQILPNQIILSDGVGAANDSVKFRILDANLRNEINGSGLRFYVVSPTAGYTFAGPLLLVRVAQNDLGTYDQYAPYSSRLKGYNGSTLAWTSDPQPEVQNKKVIYVSWGSSVEQHEIRRNCADGNTYIWLSHFGSYPITAQRVLLERNGVTTDLTNICGTDGHVYALYEITSQPYTLKVWGDVAPGAGVPPDNTFYWQATYSYSPGTEGRCWSGGGSNVRAAILQDEAWWAKHITQSEGAWDRGASGSLGKNGLPTGQNVVYGTHFEIAKDTGFLWNWRLTSGETTCISRTVGW